MSEAPVQPRVAVYAIARNEEQHLDRWATSANGAEVIVLVDTGSSDGTVARARSFGIDVHEIRVEPFRYDVARNRALDLLPRDVDLCIALDLDEVLAPGWQDDLDAAWRRRATRIRCRLHWPWSDIHPPLRFTVADRIHARHGYRWRYPVHEELVSLGPETIVGSDLGIVHLRDSTGTRPQYLELLRLRAAEHPDDGRTAHLLSSEARRNGLWEEARTHARRALSLQLSPNERLHVMLMLSHLEAAARQEWILSACAEFSTRREPWCELAQWHADQGNWRGCRCAAHVALRIVQPADDYLANVLAWGAWPDHLAARASLELGDHDLAVHHARRAVRVVPSAVELVDLLARATEALLRQPAAQPPSDASIRSAICYYQGADSAD